MGYTKKEKGNPLWDEVFLAPFKGGFLSPSEKKDIDKMTGRQVYDFPFNHTLNHLSIDRILTYALGDFTLEFTQANREVDTAFDLQGAMKEMLVDGWVFYHVDAMQWLDNVVDFQFQPSGEVSWLKQIWDYPDGIVVTHLYVFPDTLTVEIKKGRDGTIISREDMKLPYWPIVGELFLNGANYFLFPVRYQLFRLDKVIDNKAKANDRIVATPMSISGSIQNVDDLRAQLRANTELSAVTLPPDGEMKYPTLPNYAGVYKEADDLKEEILSTLNIVDVSTLQMSGISRRIALQPMLSLAKGIRKDAASLAMKISEALGLSMDLSYGSLEYLDSKDKEIELKLLDNYAEILGAETYKAEVLRILDIKK